MKGASTISVFRARAPEKFVFLNPNTLSRTQINTTAKVRQRNLFLESNTLSHTQINTTAQELGDRKHGFVNANTVASSTVCGHRQ